MTTFHSVRVQTHPIDLNEELSALPSHASATGAICSFIGVVRGDDGVQSLWLEHYPGMTEQVLHQLAEEAVSRFGAQAVRMVHRVGQLSVGEQIVAVVVSAAHRAAAFAACEFVVDHLKTQAPFWKKEITATGTRWVQPRAQDDQALARWQRSEDSTGQSDRSGASAGERIDGRIVRP